VRQHQRGVGVGVEDAEHLCGGAIAELIEVYRVDSCGRRNTKAEGGGDGGSATFGSGFAGEVSFAWPAWSSSA
jgi:hypothetical protein